MSRPIALCLSGFLVLSILGCGLGPKTSVKATAEVADADGQNRLIIQSLETVRLFKPDKPEHEFHSLAWQQKDGADWKDKYVIKAADFQGDPAKFRWVSELFSLDSNSGNAIVKVAERNAADKSPTAATEYSWWEWDLVQNKEIRNIRVCDSPQEPFEQK